VNRFLQCPYRYEQGYVKGRRDDKPVDYLNIGRSMHQALAQCFHPGSTVPLETESLQHALRASWRPDLYDNHEASELWLSKALEMAARLDDCPYFQRRPAMVESRFKTVCGQLILSGAIDRIDRTASGEMEVVDYKVGDRSASLDEVVNDYQWYFYWHGCRSLTGQSPSQITFIYLESGRSLSLGHEHMNVDDTGERLRAVVEEMLSASTFEPKANEYCSNCAFAGECAEVS
jgi:putative RecB family exonuclease